MMGIRNEIITVCLFFCSIATHAQETNSHQSYNEPDLLSATSSDESLTDEALASEIDFSSIKKRIIRNNISDFDFQECIDEHLLANWLYHELQEGPILCFEELMAVDGFNLETIKCIRDHFSLETTENVKFRFTRPEMANLIVQSRLKLLADPVRISNTEPAGSEFNNSLKFRISDSDYRAGITADKDAGERYWGKTGPDYLSFFLDYRPNGKGLEILIGDHHIQAGQGLVCGTRQFGNFLLDMGSIVNNRTSIRPHSSLSESGFRRGIALQYKKKRFSILGSFSRNSMDGSQNMITTMKDTLYVFTPDISGYHRTFNELEKRNSNTRISGIMDLLCSFKKAETGFCMLIWNDKVMQKEFLQTDRYSNLSGSFGVHGRWKTDYGQLFGEAALSMNLNPSVTAGIISNPDKKVSACLHWGCSAGIQSTPYSTTIGFMDNERMFLNISATTKPVSKAEVTPYMILRKEHSLQMKDLQVKPYAENGLRIVYKPDKRSRLMIMIRNIEKWEANVEQSEKSSTEKNLIRQIRIQAEQQPLFGLALSTRLEFRIRKNHDGIVPAYMVSEDLDLDIKTIPCKIKFRVSCFNVPDYDMAIRMNEVDLPGNFRQSILYGKGLSWYIIAQPRLKGPFGIWLKASGMRCNDRWLTDPLERYVSRSRMELSIQVRYLFKKK